MNINDASHCLEKYEGRLIIDYGVCTLQHFCESCPQYDDALCDKKCNQTGTVKRLADINGCKTTNSKCECKCTEPSCNITCRGTYFNLMKNNNGCNECKCVCPMLICDDSCNGKGLKDEAGCFQTCGECGERTGYVYIDL